MNIESRIWIYQSNRPFTDSELEIIEPELQAFVAEWTSHNRQLVATAEVLHHRFIVLGVDEQLAGASGCSIDKSVHFLQTIENQYSIELFNRMIFAYQDTNGQVVSVDNKEFSNRYRAGIINDDTLVFDTLVNNRVALINNFLKPLHQSWHKRMV